METPLITVILPFLNGGPAFAPAVASILRQTYANWELLLCDDGSTDGSLEMARAIRDPRVIVWSDGRTKGLAARLNECIARARGVYIARMDADDLSYPDRLRQQVEYLLRNPAVAVVGCPMLICQEDGTPIGKRTAPLDHDGIVASPALGFGLAHPTWMARATWYRQYLYDPSALRFEDIELLYRAHKQSRFANLAAILYGYREMSGGLRKRYKTRLGRIRYLGARRGELGNGLFVRAAAAEAFKSVIDSGLTVFSARYQWLRLREQALTPAEASQWMAVYSELQGEPALNATAERVTA